MLHLSKVIVPGIRIVCLSLAATAAAPRAFAQGQGLGAPAPAAAADAAQDPQAALRAQVELLRQ